MVEPEQAATAAILYDHIPDWGLAFNTDVASSLLSGLVGDTIGFRTSNVDSTVLRRAAALMDLGADLRYIYREELVLNLIRQSVIGVLGLNRAGV